MMTDFILELSDGMTIIKKSEIVFEVQRHIIEKMTALRLISIRKMAPKPSSSQARQERLHRFVQKKVDKHRGNIDVFF